MDSLAALDRSVPLLLLRSCSCSYSNSSYSSYIDIEKKGAPGAKKSCEPNCDDRPSTEVPAQHVETIWNGLSFAPRAERINHPKAIQSSSFLSFLDLFLLLFFDGTDLDEQEPIGLCYPAARVQHRLSPTISWLLTYIKETFDH